MPWISESEYRYTAHELEAIAEFYAAIYKGLDLSYYGNDSLSSRPEAGMARYVNNPWSIADYKADFDMALSAIGREKWRGLNSLRFKDYRRYGRLQQLVIAAILGVDDKVLRQARFYEISRLRATAYTWMANYLNGLPFAGNHTGWHKSRS